MVRRCILCLLTVATFGTLYLVYWSRSPLSLREFSENVDPILADWYYTSDLNSRVSFAFDLDKPADESADGARILFLALPSGVRIYSIAASGTLLVGWIVDRDPKTRATDTAHSLGPFHGSVTDLPGAWRNQTWHCGMVPQPPPPQYCLRAYTLVLPVWSLAVLCAVYPFYRLLLVPARAGYRRRHCRCPACGYDLIGMASLCCPECAARVDDERHQLQLAKCRARLARAVAWPREYANLRCRRALARAALMAMPAFVLLWVASYVRPTVTTPWFNLRAMWGDISVFCKPPAEEQEFSCFISGYKDLYTCWWPFQLCSSTRGWYIAPIWLLIACIFVAWYLLYRPDRHRIARKGAGQVRLARLNELATFRLGVQASPAAGCSSAPPLRPATIGRSRIAESS